MMFALFLIGLAVICSYTMGNVAAANTSSIYVSTTGNDSWNGLNSTWINGTLNGPKATIKNATGTVTNNGTIYIATGTYKESNVNINQNATIIGESQNSAIINADGEGKIFNIAGGVTVKIENLTLINGYTNGLGGAIDNGGTLIIDNCTFTGNHAGFSGGAISNSGVLTDTSCTFTSDDSPFGGAIFNGGSGVLTDVNCKFANNNGTYGGSLYTKAVHVRLILIVYSPVILAELYLMGGI